MHCKLFIIFNAKVWLVPVDRALGSCFNQRQILCLISEFHCEFSASVMHFIKISDILVRAEKSIVEKSQ